MKALIVAVSMLMISSANAGLFGNNKVRTESVNGISGHARNAGIRQCLPAIDKLSSYLLGKNLYAAHSTWHETNPDKEMFTSIAEVKFTDGTMIVDMTVTPTAGGSCAAVYQKYFHTNKSCDDTSKLFLNDRYMGHLMDKVVFLVGPGKHLNWDRHKGAEMLLMNVPGGCMAVRKEVIPDVMTYTGE